MTSAKPNRVANLVTLTPAGKSSSFALSAVAPGQEERAVAVEQEPVGVVADLETILQERDACGVSVQLSGDVWAPWHAEQTSQDASVQNF